MNRAAAPERLVDASKLRPKAWRNAALGLAAATALLTTAVLMVHGTAVVASDWGSTVERAHLNRWSTGEYEWTEPEWEAMERSVLRDMERTPQDAGLYDQLALLYSLQGAKAWVNGDPGSPEHKWYSRALEAQERSIQLRPGYAMAWANKAMFQSAIGVPDEEVFASWRRARSLGPYIPEVRATLVAVTEIHGNSAPLDVKKWSVEVDPNLPARIEKTIEEPFTLQ